MKRLTSWVQWLLGYRGIPMMSRPTFRLEMFATVFLGVALAAMRPQLTQLFARKSLEAPRWLIAALVAVFAGGSLFGAVLGPYLQRRRRTTAMVASLAGVALFLLAVALLPASAAAAVPYLGILTAASLTYAGARTTLSSIWHSNYPQAVRGQILSRRMIVHLVVGAISMKLAGWALDAWPAGGHRLIYALAAVCLLIAALLYSRIRVRGERAMIRRETRSALDLKEGLILLRDDRAYRRFMGWQMLSGSSVILIDPVKALILIDVLHVTYAQGTTAMAAVPMIACLIGLLICGRLFDRMDIWRFRGIGAGVWSLSRAMIFTGALLRVWPLLLAGFAVEGLARSTGMLAFNLGHTRFATPRKSQSYMGIHLTLLGLRGLTMPFLGVWLYGIPGVGLYLLPASAVLQLIAAGGFAFSKSGGTFAPADTEDLSTP